MRATYVWLSRLIALGVVLQAAFIAFGTFDILNSANDGRAYTGDFNSGQVLHSVFGLMVIPLLALILLIVSFFARIPGGVKWAGIVFGLVVLQILLGFISVPVPVLGILHGLNAFAVAAVAGLAGRKATLVPPTAPEPAAAV